MSPILSAFPTITKGSSELEKFDIRNFLDRLTPSKEKERYICPVCEGGNLTIGQSGEYQCWNGCDCKDIREAVSPAIKGQRRSTPQIFSQKPRKQAVPAPLSNQNISLARLESPATDAPQPQPRTDKKRGTVQVTTYPYGDLQWVERRQWVDSSKVKGHSKDFFPWHLDSENKPICKKGDREWLPYRWEEAIAAAQANHANALLMAEGEGCVEAYRAIGIAAITLSGSAWGSKDLEAFAHRCRAVNLTVVFHPDHDATGQSKAEKLNQACAMAGGPCLILNPLNLYPDLPEAGDIVDILKAVAMPEFVKRLEAEIHRATDSYSVNQTADGNAPERSPKQSITEIAAEIAENYRDRLAWNDESEQWMRYEAEFPGVWSVESDTAIGAVVLAEFESRLELGYKARWIDETIKILKWKLLIKKWDQPANLIPFQNGVLNTQSNQFMPHAPGYRLTWALPRDHNPLAKDCSTINAWLDEATGGSAALKHILLCWLNACLKGRSDLQRFLHLTGPGGTGKGTFIRLAISLIGAKNHHPSSLADWCGNRFEPVNAYKKRLITFPDEDKYLGGLGNFKKLTGGDAIRGEIKRKQAFDFQFEGMVMLASNYPIFSGDTSSGIYRRLLMVPFNQVVSPFLRRNLDADFASELAALTNTVLDIPDQEVADTLRQSVSQSAEVIDRTWDYRIRQDSVAAWLNECVIREPLACERVGNDRGSADTLFGSYYRYCEQSGSRPKGSREFSPALLELVNSDPALNWGVEKKRVAGGFMIYGLRLRTENDLERPYCLEALSESSVGSIPNVGCNVECDVGSKPLPSKVYVGCVESTDLITQNSNQTEALSEKNELPCESAPERNLAPYTPYISQSQQEIETLHDVPTVQDEAPYMDEIPLEKWLTPESLSEIREQWAAAETDQEREVWRQVIPIEVLERAIA